MYFQDLLKISLNALTTNKARSALTMIGMIIGTAAVVATVSLGLGGKNFVIGQIEKMGANLIYMYWEGFYSAQQQPAGISKYDLTEKDVKALQQTIPTIKAIAPIIWSYTTLFYEQKEPD